MSPIGNLKEIFIGKYIEERINESGISRERIAKFINYNEHDLSKIFESKSIDSETLLRLSKVLEYDFFRLYTQHLIFYAPVAAINLGSKEKKTTLPQFRKNIYTTEVINFILGLIRNNEKSIKEILNEYRIPKTTLYRWLSKY